VAQRAYTKVTALHLIRLKTIPDVNSRSDKINTRAVPRDACSAAARSMTYLISKKTCFRCVDFTARRNFFVLAAALDPESVSDRPK
jgi:hypothetical protein